MVLFKNTSLVKFLRLEFLVKAKRKKPVPKDLTSHSHSTLLWSQRCIYYSISKLSVDEICIYYPRFGSPGNWVFQARKEALFLWRQRKKHKEEILILVNFCCCICAFHYIFMFAFSTSQRIWTVVPESLLENIHIFLQKISDTFFGRTLWKLWRSSKSPNPLLFIVVLLPRKACPLTSVDCVAKPERQN